MAPADQPARPADATAPDRDSELLRRLLWLMMCRVAVAILLLGVSVFADVESPAAVGLIAGRFIFPLISFTFGLALIWALVFRRHLTPRNTMRLAAAQLIGDLVAAMTLTWVTGATESAFVFLYLLIIVAAASILPPRAALAMTVATALVYLGSLFGAASPTLAAWLGLPVLPGPAEHPRDVALHLVAFAATALLAGRLSAELRRAGAHLVAQGERLDELSALHADVVRSLSAGLITLTEDGRVLTINPVGAEILGTSPAGALGRPIDEVWPGFAVADRQPGHEPLARLETVVKLGDGAERVVGASASPLRSAQGRVIGRLLHYQDLTELRRMQAQVERSRRLAALGQLAAGIAHEIRNPLAAISGSMELLRRSSGPAEAENVVLWDIVEREVARLDSLITELLDFARPRPRESAPIEVKSAIEEVLRVCANDRGLQTGPVELHAEADLWIDADPGQLRQVLWNILRNALQAAGSGPVEVRAHGVTGGGRDEVEVTVRDRGAGIAEQHRARLGEPFFSTKRGGVGLGLASVQGILADHGGRFAIGNAPGGGAFATVSLPRRAAPPAGQQ